MVAIGYVRVSTDRQAEQGVSLEAQEAKIRAMAMVQGVDLAEVIVDGGESAKSLKRPLVKLIGAGESPKGQMGGLVDLTYSGAVRSGAQAWAESGVKPADIKYASI